MNTHCLRLLVVAFACTLLTLSPGFAQDVQLPKLPEKPDTLSAQALYEEANNFLDKKFAEFNNQKVAYDPKLDATTKQEQRSCRAKRRCPRSAGRCQNRER